jgi:AMME syndrome candidate gene 1 protein
LKFSVGNGSEANAGVSPRLEATYEMCFHCFDTLVEELHGKSRSSRWRHNRPTPAYAKDLPDPAVECPIFVTWEILRPSPGFPANLLLGGNDNNGQPEYDLRGCIGSLSPKPLIKSVGDYALTSALRDRRFQPVTAPEIPSLRVAVSLLVQYEACEDCFDWVVGTHGILIRFVKSNREFSATYLPEVAKEQGWDQKEAVTALIRKSSYAGLIDHELFRSIQCTR